jgi:hypothetical protein
MLDLAPQVDVRLPVRPTARPTAKPTSQHLLKPTAKPTSRPLSRGYDFYEDAPAAIENARGYDFSNNEKLQKGLGIALVRGAQDTELTVEMDEDVRVEMDEDVMDPRTEYIEVTSLDASISEGSVSDMERARLQQRL